MFTASNELIYLSQGEFVLTNICAKRIWWYGKKKSLHQFIKDFSLLIKQRCPTVGKVEII